MATVVSGGDLNPAFFHAFVKPKKKRSPNDPYSRDNHPAKQQGPSFGDHIDPTNFLTWDNKMVSVFRYIIRKEHDETYEEYRSRLISCVIGMGKYSLSRQLPASNRLRGNPVSPAAEYWMKIAMSEIQNGYSVYNN